MLRQKLLPTPTAIAAGSTSTFNLDLGLRYHAIWLELGDSVGIAGGDLRTVLAAAVDQIRLKVNGKVQRTMTAAELYDINSLMGAAFAASSSGTRTQAGYRMYLPIWLAEPWRKNNAEVPLTAWNAQGIASLQLEVDLHAGLTAPVLTGWFEYDNATGNLGAITKWIRQTFAAAGTQMDINTIDKRDYLNSIHFYPESSNTRFVNKLRLTANGAEIRGLMTALENQAMLLGRELVPDQSATPRFDLVLDYDDPINNALNCNGLAELTVHVEFDAAAAGGMVAIIQRTGAPE
jgi:hypothetical protein